MVRIERNVSILDYTSVDCQVLSEAMRDYAAERESSNGCYHQLSGMAEWLTERVDDEDLPEIIRQKAGAWFEALERFCEKHDLKETDYFYFWW